jgi:hypothetical protein
MIKVFVIYILILIGFGFATEVEVDFKPKFLPIHVGWNNKNGGYLMVDGKISTPIGEVSISVKESIPDSLMTRTNRQSIESQKQMNSAKNIIHDTVYAINNVHKVFVREPNKTSVYVFSGDIKFQFDVNSVFVAHKNGDYEVIVETNDMIDSLQQEIKLANERWMKNEKDLWKEKIAHSEFSNKQLYVILENNCKYDIFIAWHYQDYFGDWLTGGWIKVSPESSEKLYMNTNNTYVCLFAESGADTGAKFIWSGTYNYPTTQSVFTFFDKNDYSFLKEIKKNGFFLRHIENGQIIPFTCQQ